MTPTPILTPKLEPHQMYPSSDYGLLSSENLTKSYRQIPANYASERRAGIF